MDNVHEYQENGKTRFVVARYKPQGKCYVAPARPGVFKISGCSELSASTPAGVAETGTYNYARRSDAVRRAAQIYGDD